MTWIKVISLTNNGNERPYIINNEKLYIMYIYVKILAYYLKEQEREQNTHEGEDPVTKAVSTMLLTIDTIIMISIDNNMN